MKDFDDIKVGDSMYFLMKGSDGVYQDYIVEVTETKKEGDEVYISFKWGDSHTKTYKFPRFYVSRYELLPNYVFFTTYEEFIEEIKRILANVEKLRKYVL